MKDVTGLYRHQQDRMQKQRKPDKAEREAIARLDRDAEVRARTIRELEEGGWLRHKENCGVDSMAAGYKCDCGLSKAKGERP